MLRASLEKTYPNIDSSPFLLFQIYGYIVSQVFHKTSVWIIRDYHLEIKEGRTDKHYCKCAIINDSIP